MSERGAGFGPFLLGLGIGAVLGCLFAPEPGEATRGKLQRQLRGLRDLAAEKAGEFEQLLEGEPPDEQADEGPSRAVLERRLTDAKRRRRAPKSPARLAAPDEEDDPVA